MRNKIAIATLILVAGLTLTVKSAFASVDLSGVTVPYADPRVPGVTFTDYIKGCENDAGQSCNKFVIIFFNDGAYYANTTLGVVSAGAPLYLDNIQQGGLGSRAVSLYMGTTTGFISAYWECNEDLTNCDYTGTGGAVSVTNGVPGGGYDVDQLSHVVSTRDIYATTTGLIKKAVSTDNYMLSFYPNGSQTVASSSATTTSFSFYLKGSDWKLSDYYSYSLTRVGLGGRYYPVYTSGSGVKVGTVPTYNYFSTTTDLLEEGTYMFQVRVMRPKTGVTGFFIGGSSEIIASSSVFYVGTPTNTNNVLSTIQTTLESALASTTANLGTTCNPIGGGFSVGDCLLGIFVPPASIWADDLVLLRTMPPWGYIFRFYDIFSNEASSSLVIFHAKTPAALGFGQSEITLDLNHSLDQFLYATSGVFLTTEASSTKTLYEITSFYWEIILTIALALYILRRILGQNLIGGFGDRGALSDTSSKDDSYKLKEKLYEMSKRK